MLHFLRQPNHLFFLGNYLLKLAKFCELRTPNSVKAEEVPKSSFYRPKSTVSDKSVTPARLILSQQISASQTLCSVSLRFEVHTENKQQVTVFDPAFFSRVLSRRPYIFLSKFKRPKFPPFFTYREAEMLGTKANLT